MTPGLQTILSTYALNPLASRPVEGMGLGGGSGADNSKLFTGAPSGGGNSGEARSSKPFTSIEEGPIRERIRGQAAAQAHEFSFSQGRYFHYFCLACREPNGGGMDGPVCSMKARQEDPYCPLNLPCVWCGGGPIVVLYDDQIDRSQPGKRIYPPNDVLLAQAGARRAPICEEGRAPIHSHEEAGAGVARSAEPNIPLPPHAEEPFNPVLPPR